MQLENKGDVVQGLPIVHEGSKPAPSHNLSSIKQQSEQVLSGREWN